MRCSSKLHLFVALSLQGDNTIPGYDSHNAANFILRTRMNALQTLMCGNPRIFNADTVSLP